MCDSANLASVSTANVRSAVELATALRDQLAAAQVRLVLVESCTAGRVAAYLGLLPGISQWLCGSLVVYRSASKSAWLGVPASLLEDPQHGPVSPAASRWLAEAALERTPEADLAVAITGDVGPGAPQKTDGCIFLAAALRRCTAPHASAGATAQASAAEWSTIITEQQQHLSAAAPRDSSDMAARQARLDEAAQRALGFALHAATLHCKP